MGGETVYDQSFADGSLASKSVAVRWDTTHFPHGAARDIKVKAKMKVWRGIKVFPSESWIYWEGPYEVSAPEAAVSVSIYNYGWAGELSDRSSWPTAYDVGQKFEAMNHFNDTVLGIGNSDKQSVVNGIMNSTVFFFHGHGACGKNPDSSSHFGVYDKSWMITNTNVAAYRSFASALGIPPMNFAFLATCGTGINNQMAEGFLYPWFEGVIDRAEMGWRGQPAEDCNGWTAQSPWHKKFSVDFMQYMSETFSADDARKEAYEDLKEFLAANSDLPQLPFKNADVTYYVTLWGDKQTRLYGLYNGQDGTAPANWYIVY